MAEGLTPEQERVAIKTPEHLKAWLKAKGLEYMCLSSLDMVNALPWPDGVEAFMQCISAYRDHRAAKGSSEFLGPEEWVLAMTQFSGQIAK